MQYAFTGYGGYHQLTNYTEIWRADMGKSLWVKLSPYDVFSISSYRGMAHIRDQTFLIIDNGTVRDTTGELVVKWGGIN